ncbi:Myo-inositol-1-phosphate synthase [Marasmius sp. AFHP31]|nr:Myo-inositol-1-phosphate synthase [Marasmius sp. AFHP31]
MKYTPTSWFEATSPRTCQGGSRRTASEPNRAVVFWARITERHSEITLGPNETAQSRRRWNLPLQGFYFDFVHYHDFEGASCVPQNAFMPGVIDLAEHSLRSLEAANPSQVRSIRVEAGFRRFPCHCWQSNMSAPTTVWGISESSVLNSDVDRSLRCPEVGSKGVSVGKDEHPSDHIVATKYVSTASDLERVVNEYHSRIS